MKKLFFVLVFIAIQLMACEPEDAWICPGKDATVLFYQGAGNSQVQGSQYRVNRPFVSPTTKQLVVSKTGINVFKNIWVDPEIPNVILAEREEGIFHAIIHPLQALQESIIRKSYKGAQIEVLNASDSSPTQTLAAHSIQWSKVSLGQDSDLKVHRSRLESFLQKHGDSQDQIWMGPSMGAAVTLLAAAVAQKENPRLLNGVKLIILEGCYGSVNDDLQTLHKPDYQMKAFEYLFTTFTEYKNNGINPFDMVGHFPKHITVGFVTSEADEQVPAQETEKLVKKLVESGVTRISLLKLKHSSHCNYVASNPHDARTYQNYMHALFKDCRLPHIPAYAQEGKEVLENAKKCALNVRER